MPPAVGKLIYDRPSDPRSGGPPVGSRYLRATGPGVQVDSDAAFLPGGSGAYPVPRLDRPAAEHRSNLDIASSRVRSLNHSLVPRATSALVAPGPVIANMIPGICRLANRIRWSGEYTGPVNSLSSMSLRATGNVSPCLVAPNRCVSQRIVSRLPMVFPRVHMALL